MVVVMKPDQLHREVREAARRFLRDLGERGAAPVRTWRGPFAPLIDHTLLRPEATAADVRRVCEDAARVGCGAVCVASSWVPHAVAALRETPDIQVCGVVGFPAGFAIAEAKALEARFAVEEGADEVDAVANLGALAGGDWAAFSEDVARVVDAARGAPVKVILESALHSPVVLAAATRAAVLAGAAYVKTSTGFHPAGGATPQAVAWIGLAAQGAAKVKASGGLRTCERARVMLAAGAERLGTSRGPDLAQCDGVVEVHPEDYLERALLEKVREGEFRL
jgi:deoxyribose-phosphate aldolase